MTSLDPFEFEKKAIPVSEWHRVPGHIMDIVHEDIEAGYPIAFAYDEDLGWVILSTGQGPFIIHVENEP